MLTDHRGELDRLAEALLEEESLDREEITEMFGEKATKPHVNLNPS